MNKNTRFSPPAVGAVSLLVVFAVLCLTVFALLSLTTVQADIRLADASARAVIDYYEADCEAQEILACLRTGAMLPEGVTVDQAEGEGAEGTSLLRYAVPISDTQELQVELTLDADGHYTILRWQSVPTGDWEYDDSLDLWDGDIVIIE